MICQSRGSCPKSNSIPFRPAIPIPIAACRGVRMACVRCSVGSEASVRSETLHRRGETETAVEAWNREMWSEWSEWSAETMQ